MDKVNQSDKVKKELDKLKRVKSLPEEVKKSIEKKQQYINNPFTK